MKTFSMLTLAVMLSAGIFGANPPPKPKPPPPPPCVNYPRWTYPDCPNWPEDAVQHPTTVK